MLREKVEAAGPRLIPPTIMSWANGLPPHQCRLPIDDVLTILVRRKHRPFIRSDTVILAEFPTLNWDGPYRTARYYLHGFLMFGMHDQTIFHTQRMRITKAMIKLLRDIQISIHVYVDTNEEVNDLKTLQSDARTAEERAWHRNFDALKKAIRNAEFLEKVAQSTLRDYEKGGRPPAYWKSNFVSTLAELWRVMTGCVASRDLTSEFASFVSAAWTSLGNDLPEISWDSQIRRREDVSPSAAKLVEWANGMRGTSLEYLPSYASGEAVSYPYFAPRSMRAGFPIS
jgi:hypothetical protein